MRPCYPEREEGTVPALGRQRKAMHALPPELQALVDHALLTVEGCAEDRDFLDALVHAEREGELTREQALTLGSLLGRQRANDIARALMGASA
jgi:hypothetical protein